MVVKQRLLETRCDWGRGDGRDGGHQEHGQQLCVRYLCFKPLDVKEIVEITERSLVYLQYIVLMKRLNLEADLTDDVKKRILHYDKTRFTTLLS